MAGKVRIPDLEPDAVRNVALIVSESSLEPKSITAYLPALKRERLAIITCSTLRLIDATVNGWDKVKPTIRRDGSAPLKAQTRIIIAEIKNSEEIKWAKRRLKEAGYEGRVIFICSQTRLSQFNKQFRQEIIFVGRNNCQAFARLVDSYV